MAVVSPNVNVTSSLDHPTVVVSSVELQSANSVSFELGLNSDVWPPPLTLNPSTTGGPSVGTLVGFPFSTVGRGVVGAGTGEGVGSSDGRNVGCRLGSRVGVGVGSSVGRLEGSRLGRLVGFIDGNNVGE